MIDFPANPTVGQQFTAAGVTWVWDGAKWTASGLSVAYVPLAGFVPAMNDNRLINGDMRIDQRNAGAGVTPIGGQYVIDRWCAGMTQAGKFTAARYSATVGGTLPSMGFGYYLGLVSTSAYALLAGDTFNVRQPIEADFCADFGWGTPNAQPVTLSFIIVSSTLTGTFGGAISNSSTGAATRSYPFTFSIPVASTWTKIVVTIPGDSLASSTNWVLQGSGVGVCLWLGLGAGSAFSAPAGAWANGDFRSANGAVSVVSTNGASISFTGVKLEIGSVATPFNRQSLAKSMADCQRYYQTGQVAFGNFNGIAGAGSYASANFQTVMRAAPTITTGATNSTNFTLTSWAQNLGFTGVTAVGTVIAAGAYNINFGFTASAEL